MKKHLLTILFVLGLSAAVAMAQAASRGGAANLGPPDQRNPQVSGTAQADQSSAGQMGTESNKNSAMANVDDDSLHRQVHDQLAANPDLQNVQITVKNGVVTLEGTVPKKEDKKEAKKLAKSVPGVKGVKEHLTVGSGASSASVGTGGVSGAAAGTGSAAGKTQQSSASISGQASTTQPSTGTTTGQAVAATGAATPSVPPASEPGAQSSATAQSGQNSMPAPSSATGGASGQATAPSAAAPPASEQSAIGAQAGATAQSGTPAQTTEQPSSTGAQSQAGAAAGSDTQLQDQIQTALKNEPTLANNTISVNVTADKIDLSGSVATGKEKQTAKRIAESYAGNRKVVDHMTVSGMGKGANTGDNPSSNSPEKEKPPKD